MSAIEHKAVLETAAFIGRIGGVADLVAVDGNGLIDPAAVAVKVGASTAVVSVMAANNEIGTVQPVAEITAAVRTRDADVLVHTDAVQAFLTESLQVSELGVDMLSLSAHKIGGPQGVGLLWVRQGIELEPVLHGGAHELGRRSGTHNVAGIIGMAAAMEAAAADRSRLRSELLSARNRFEEVVTDKVAGVQVTAAEAPRLAQHSHMRFRGLEAETLLIRLDQRGIAAGAGAACQSGAIESSHVLAALGMTDEAARECVRFTFGWVTEAGDGELAARGVIETVDAMS